MAKSCVVAGQRSERVRMLSSSSWETATSCTDTLAYGVTRNAIPPPVETQNCHFDVAPGVSRGPKTSLRNSRGIYKLRTIVPLNPSGSASLRPCGLTPILHSPKMQNTAHADTPRSLSEEQGNQARAPRAGVGLQPPASVADTDGADGADTTLYRGDRVGLPPTLARARSGRRTVRP